MTSRHSWSEPRRPDELRTERTCTRCGVVKITRHDAGASAIPWVEFYDANGFDLEEIRTPPCVPNLEAAPS